MKDNNVYEVAYKTVSEPKSCDVVTVGEFECDRERYLFELKKAMKNGLQITATDSLLLCPNGEKADGTRYILSIYIW